jgi:hypothetical protein
MVILRGNWGSFRQSIMVVHLSSLKLQSKAGWLAGVDNY